MKKNSNTHLLPIYRRLKKSASCLLFLFVLMPFCANAVPGWTLTTSVTGGHGSIQPPTGGQADGDVVELTTTPDPGYRAAVWTGTDYDTYVTSNNFVTMDTDKTVTVQFEKIPVVSSETRMETTSTHTTNNEWVTCSYQNGTNLFREANGTLHMALVENYELWYFKSSDNGKNWSREKVPTSLDGKVRYTVMTVDQNGKVFIGFTTNPNYNYGLSSVSGTRVYQFDVYGADNVSGSWAISSKLYTGSNGSGYFVSGIAVDGNNDVHLFATRYGWYADGGDAKEWVRDTNTNIWGDSVTVCHFTGNEKIIRWYSRALVDSNGNITVFMKRNTSGNEILFYVTNSTGSWGTPVEVKAGGVNTNWNGPSTFDAAIDKNDVIYLVYFMNNSSGETETIFSDDLGATSSVIYTGTSGQSFYDLKLHSDGNGNLTTIIRRQNEHTILIEKPAGSSWSTAYDLPTIAPDGDIWNIMTVKTDTYSKSFTGFKLSYMDDEVASPPRTEPAPYGPYGPFYVYYNNLSEVFPWTMFLPAVIGVNR